ncbi:MAG TPA: TonB-dependent siderophore receptor, partial [Rudaea sp.]|nr:TonB-dependent siderophore receptor [Rudaea sp.]
MSFSIRVSVTALCMSVLFLVMPAAAQSVTGTDAEPNAHAGLAANTHADDVGADASTDQTTKLPAVPVDATYPYRIESSSTATRTDTPLIDTPQTIQAIPAKVLRDQASKSLEDALRNAPGVYVKQGEGNRDQVYIRGVDTKSDFFVDGMRDDTEYFRDLYNVEHVDVLQGPAAVLFGRGGAGGVINLVTKQPQRQSIRELSLELGSSGHQRGTFDMGDAIGSDAAFRVLGMIERSESYRDHDFVHRQAINPKLRWQAGENTVVDFGLSYLTDYRFADRGIPSRDGRPVDVPRSKMFGSIKQNRAQSRVQAFNASISHEFNDQLKLRNEFRVNDNDRFYVNAYAASAVNDQDELKMKAYNHPNNRLSYLDRTELVSDFSTGRVRHKLLFGAEFGWQRGNDMETLPAPGSKNLPGTYPLSDPTVQPVAFAYLDRNNHVVGKEFGLYAEDQVTLSERWLGLLGVRRDRFSVDADYRKPGVTPNHTYNSDTEWSPRAGLIFKPAPNDSIYASVTQTFTPQGANIALSRKSPEGANLAPEKATNYEIGNKLDLFDGGLSLTAALFQLQLDNVVSSAADGSGQLLNTGAQRNRGAQFSIEGDLSKNWSVYANYAYIDAQITKTTKDAAAGAQVGLVPHNQYSLWTRYALTSRWGVGAGIRGESQKYTSYDNDVV